MKRLLQHLSAISLALAMVAVPLTASADHTSGRNSHFSSNGRPSQSSRPSSSSRPGNNGNHNGNHKPNNGNHNGNHKPNKPNNGHNNYKPNPGHGHGHTPARPVYYGHNHPKHHVPFFGYYHRPVRPTHWHPAVAGPSFGTILGVTLGSTINFTVNTLLNQGYTVSSYGNDVVYLQNVPQMNYYWPDAALYYNNGALCGSSFTYPTTYYDASRYNALYNTFTRQYGAPVNVANTGGVMSATWFGGGNRFVTIEFNQNYGNYYTTLSFGM